jgi:hypothetical protein
MIRLLVLAVLIGLALTLIGPAWNNVLAIKRELKTDPYAILINPTCKTEKGRLGPVWQQYARPQEKLSLAREAPSTSASPEAASVELSLITHNLPPNETGHWARSEVK